MYYFVLYKCMTNAVNDTKFLIIHFLDLSASATSVTQEPLKAVPDFVITLAAPLV